MAEMSHTQLVVVMVVGFALQLGAAAFIAVLAVLVYRQGQRFSPGEAAIYRNTDKLTKIYEEMRRTLDEAMVKP